MTKSEEIAAAFQTMDLPDHDPKWSSSLLETLVTDHLVRKQGSISDLFQGFDLALRRSDPPLSLSVANLIRDVVQVVFLKDQKSYMAADWGWVDQWISPGIKPAQAYLFVQALPANQVRPASLLILLRALEPTAHFDEALHNLADELACPEFQEPLQQWRANGMRPEVAEKLDVFLVGC